MKGTHKGKKACFYISLCYSLSPIPVVVYFSRFLEMDVNVLLASNDLGVGGGGVMQCYS